MDSIKILLSSKRVIIAVTSLLAGVLVHKLGMDEAAASELSVHIYQAGLALVVGISASDTGKALGMPAGIDHKGRGVPTSAPTADTVPGVEPAPDQPAGD